VTATIAPHIFAAITLFGAAVVALAVQVPHVRRQSDPWAELARRDRKAQR
jgi:hypothetical protein